jgi:acyl-coenzyme A synthetase/AMP-(fatty) acid ligase
VSRTDDIIKTGGEKVSPLEIERVLHELRGVKEAAVVGARDEALGQAIVAYVVTDGDDTLTAASVRRHCRERLEGYMVPSRIEFLATLPQTASGKVSRSRLKPSVTTTA